MGRQIQISYVLAIAIYIISAKIDAREIPTSPNHQHLRGPQSAASAVAASAHSIDNIDADDDSPSKRELGEISYHHGGGGGGHHHGHATSYQNYVLHSYHPKKVIYHKKHGHHHHSPPPGVPVHAIPHHVPVPVAPASIPVYDDGSSDDGSYTSY